MSIQTAMILAAGRGERLRPITDHTPKPLVKVQGKPLIQYHIEALKRAGIKNIVVNVAWLAEQLMEFLGDGSPFGVTIKISHEKNGALETAGGIAKALPLLGDKPFLVINADIFTDYDFANLPNDIGNDDMHLVLVDNPEHHPEGDLYFENNRIVQNGTNKKTFAGIGIYQAYLFKAITEDTKLPLREIFMQSLQKNKISAELFDSKWTDVGNIERLEILNS